MFKRLYSVPPQSGNPRDGEMVGTYTYTGISIRSVKRTE